MIEPGPQAGRGKSLARSYDFIVCGSGSSGSEELHRDLCEIRALQSHPEENAVLKGIVSRREPS